MAKKFVCTMAMGMHATMESELVSVSFLDAFRSPCFKIFLLLFRCYCVSGGFPALGRRVLLSPNLFSENPSPLRYGRFWILRLIEFIFHSWLKAVLIMFSYFLSKIAFWSFLWAVGFIYLASVWSKTPSSPEAIASANNLQAAIAFSFFSGFTALSSCSKYL